METVSEGWQVDHGCFWIMDHGQGGGWPVAARSGASQQLGRRGSEAVRATGAGGMWGRPDTSPARPANEDASFWIIGDAGAAQAQLGGCPNRAARRASACGAVARGGLLPGRRHGDRGRRVAWWTLE